jgi:hypothetical protein
VEKPPETTSILDIETEREVGKLASHTQPLSLPGTVSSIDVPLILLDLPFRSMNRVVIAYGISCYSGGSLGRGSDRSLRRDRRPFLSSIRFDCRDSSWLSRLSPLLHWLHVHGIEPKAAV